MVSPKKKHSLLVFLRAQLSAQFATLVDFALTFVCFRWFGLYYLLATSLGSIAGHQLRHQLQMDFRHQGLPIQMGLFQIYIGLGRQLYLECRRSLRASRTHARPYPPLGTSKQFLSDGGQNYCSNHHRCRMELYAPPLFRIQGCPHPENIQTNH